MAPDLRDSVQENFNQLNRLRFHRIHTLLEPLGMYPGQPQLLRVLERKDGLSQKELAAKLHIRSATLTVMLGRMEKSGLTRRLQDERDLRVSRVYLTEAGRALCARAREAMREIDEDTFGSLSEEELEQLNSLLVRMRDRLLEKRENPGGERSWEPNGRE